MNRWVWVFISLVGVVSAAEAGENAPALENICLHTPVVQVAPTGRFGFTFLHRFTFEQALTPGGPSGPEGGVMELSSDRGQTWEDIGATALPGYNTTISAGEANPLQDRRAYGDVSEGYPSWIPVTVDLGTAYQGQTVWVRFRVSSEDDTALCGWDIDALHFEGITEKAVNQPPVAQAGEDAAVLELSSLELDGTLSSDPDGDALTYLWTQTYHSSLDLIGATTAKPILHAPSTSYEQYVVYTVTVSDGEFTASDKVTVIVRNHPGSPVAIIADPEPEEVSAGQLVTLDGSESMDPDGDPLTFSWVQLAGPQEELTGANTAQITFTAPTAYTPFTLLRFQLTVSDGTTLSEGAITSITVRLNRPPIISAGNDLFVEEGSTVLLFDSGGYDPDGTRLMYQWTQTVGPPARINPTGHPQPYIFFLPEVTETTVFTFMLTASDGVNTVSDSMNITVKNRNLGPVANEGAASGTVNVTVRDVNREPTAHAGEDQTVAEHSTVVLDGSGTDPDGDALTYAWTQTAGPTVALSSATAEKPSFQAPHVRQDTVLTFTLTVTDVKGEGTFPASFRRSRPQGMEATALSAEDTVSITVTEKQHPEDPGGGCGCSSGRSAAGPLMPLLLLGGALLSRRRRSPMSPLPE
ncbi:PKD domain-containing protein [Stigmatella hybrida]|uniref:PKD domain-containing protein n=1 Tax=Stigmatella hybrida TaxID=394097 RepID=UPI001CDA873E|nr:Ig-like domain-containing protein [Stigmatella hybrida]